MSQRVSERVGERVRERVRERVSKFGKFPSPEDGFRAVVERVPRAEELAASWIERVRPFFTSVYVLRRRIATICVAVVAVSLFAHVMFGANGMIVYKQKRAEYETLHVQIVEEQAENQRFTQEIEALKKDEKAIEKEAREQLGYARPGEYVYVAPTPAKAIPSANHSAKK